MTLATTIKHLRAVHADGSEIAPVRRRALLEAIAWLAGEERMRKIRADLRERVIDHLDGNPRNWSPDNLRVTTMPERASNHVPQQRARRVPTIIISTEGGR